MSVTNITVGGGSATLTITGNTYVASHVSMFASMAMQLASAANSFYTPDGGSTLFVAPNDMGNVDVDGLTPSANILVGDDTTLFYHGSSNAMIEAGNGDDTVNAGAGNDTIDLGAGNNQIVLGTGNSLVTSEGTDNIQLGSGIDTVNLQGNSSTVYGGYGTSGYTGTSMVVNDQAGSNSLIFAATKGSLVYGSNLTNTTVVAFGNTTVYGGAMADHVYAGNGAVMTLTGNASGNIMVANDGRYANGTNVKLDGSAATGDNNQFWAGSGNSTLVGGTGADILVAGTGAVTMSGGTGKANDFLFFSGASTGGGNATITDFASAAGNKLFLLNYGGASAITYALANAQQVGANTQFHLSDGTSITLDNFSRSNLVVADFVGT